ncbi:MAG: YciI family protein, partial [Terriglobales bacterium]
GFASVQQRTIPKGEMTMRFMMLMLPKGYDTAAPGAMPDPKAVAAMMKYNESLQKAGVLLALDGLHPPSMGARVTFSGGKAKVTDGPFTEAKEVIGGYWMIQVKSKEEAVEWASRCPASDNEMIELRQVQDFSEFPADVREAAAGFSELPGQSGRKVS